jgi:hypothetical protein
MASGKRMWLVCHGIQVDCRPMPMAGRQNIAHIRLYFSDANSEQSEKQMKPYIFKRQGKCVVYMISIIQNCLNSKSYTLANHSKV